MTHTLRSRKRSISATFLASSASARATSNRPSMSSLSRSRSRRLNSKIFDRCSANVRSCAWHCRVRGNAIHTVERARRGEGTKLQEDNQRVYQVQAKTRCIYNFTVTAATIRTPLLKGRLRQQDNIGTQHGHTMVRNIYTYRNNRKHANIHHSKSGIFLVKSILLRMLLFGGASERFVLGQFRLKEKTLYKI